MRSLFITAIIAAVSVSPVHAEGPAPFADFSAKFVKPPAKGAKKRVLVQIAPAPAPVPKAQPQATAVAAAPAPSRPGSYDWFWQAVSPRVEDSGPGRLEPALIRLGNPPQGRGVAAPRLQQLQNIAEAHGKDILRATIGTRVSPALVLAVISVESAGRKDAVSSAGAQGLMQLMPATATRFGVTDSFDTAQNIAGGVRFLDFLMEKFDGDPILVLAGYNAGENSIGKHGGVPPFAETRDYVPKVLAAFNVAKGLCLTPPMLASDGCVFRISAG